MTTKYIRGTLSELTALRDSINAERGYPMCAHCMGDPYGLGVHVRHNEVMLTSHVDLVPHPVTKEMVLPFDDICAKTKAGALIVAGKRALTGSLEPQSAIVAVDAKVDVGDASPVPLDTVKVDS